MNMRMVVESERRAKCDERWNKYTFTVNNNHGKYFTSIFVKISITEWCRVFASTARNEIFIMISGLSTYQWLNDLIYLLCHSDASNAIQD